MSTLLIPPWARDTFLEEILSSNLKKLLRETSGYIDQVLEPIDKGKKVLDEMTHYEKILFLMHTKIDRKGETADDPNDMECFSSLEVLSSLLAKSIDTRFPDQEFSGFGKGFNILTTDNQYQKEEDSGGDEEMDNYLENTFVRNNFPGMTDD